MAIDKAILDLPLEARAEMALRKAVRGVYEEHLRLGLPVYVWRDGKVVALSPQQIKESLAKPEAPLATLTNDDTNVQKNPDRKSR